MKNARMQEYLNTWLKKCKCENWDHCLEDMRDDQQHLVLLRPAINSELKPDLVWLQEHGAKYTNFESFIQNLRSKLIWKRGNYDYKHVAPILCKNCATTAGYRVEEGWGVATLPVQHCVYCEAHWDPWDDDVPGAQCSIKGRPACVVCFLRANLKDKSKGPTLNGEQPKNLNVVTNEIKERKSKKSDQRRQQNQLIYEDWLLQHSCFECGQSEFKQLVALPGTHSPKGYCSEWKRDCSNEVFAERMMTTQVYCKTCKKKEV